MSDRSNPAAISFHVTQTTVALPCFDLDTGVSISLTADKTVAQYAFTGALTFANDITGTYDVGTSPTQHCGVRQAASVNGTQYWLSGDASDAWGYRYLPSFGAGVTFSVDGIVSSEPGFSDARGVTAFGGQLYGSDSPSDSGFGGAFTELLYDVTLCGSCPVMQCYASRSCDVDFLNATTLVHTIVSFHPLASRRYLHDRLWPSDW